MTKQAFRVEGDFQMGRVRQAFGLDIVAANADEAKEHAILDLGSRHGAPRRVIKVAKITPLRADQIEDKITKKKLGL